MTNSNLQHYVIVCDKKDKKKFLELVAAYSGVGVQTAYGRGSAKAGSFAKALGFETEEHKVLICAIMPTVKAQELTEVLKTKYDFQGANTGIGFSIPIQGLSV